MVLPVFLFILGLAVGSFLNVVIMRSERGEALTGRSHCDTCGKTLTWRELIPLVSFMYQKGRCRHCGTVLSAQYPLVEFATGFIFAAVAGEMFYEILLTGNIFSLLALCVVLASVATMIVIVVTDINHHIILNGSVLVLAVLGVAATLARNELVCISTDSLCGSFSFSGIVWDLGASIGAVIFLFALWFFSKGRAMGFGDVKLIGATSLLLGFPLSILALLFSFWLGGIWGIGLLLLRVRSLKSQIAFGPFIIAGTILAFLFGQSFLMSSGFYYLFPTHVEHPMALPYPMR